MCWLPHHWDTHPYGGMLESAHFYNGQQFPQSLEFSQFFILNSTEYPLCSILKKKLLIIFSIYPNDNCNVSLLEIIKNLLTKSHSNSGNRYIHEAPPLFHPNLNEGSWWEMRYYKSSVCFRYIYHEYKGFEWEICWMRVGVW